MTNPGRNHPHGCDMMGCKDKGNRSSERYPDQNTNLRRLSQLATKQSSKNVVHKIQITTSLRQLLHYPCLSRHLNAASF